jgi:hypothetical protein
MRNAAILSYSSSDGIPTQKTSAYIQLVYSGVKRVPDRATLNDTCNYIHDIARDLEGIAQRARQPDLAARLHLVVQATKVERNTP